MVFGIFLNLGDIVGAESQAINYSLMWVYNTNGSANSVSASSDGNYIAVGTSKGIYFLDGNKNLLWYNETDHPIIDTSMTVNGNYTVAGGSSGYFLGGAAYHFNITGNLIATTPVSTGISSVSYSPDGKKYFGMTYTHGLGWKDIVALWSYIEEKWLWYYTFGRHETADASVSSNGEYVTVGSASPPTGGNGGLRLYNKAGNLLWEYAIDTTTLSGGKYSVAMSSDGKYIAAGNEENVNIYFFEKDQKLLWNYSIGNVQGVSISADGGYIVAASEDNVYLFDRYKNIVWTSNISNIKDVAISGDKDVILVLTGDKLYVFASSPVSCSDNIKNSDETDVDCGGSCPPCEEGKLCLYKADCVSNYCNPNRICSIPSCYDGWKNGEETGVDCDGYCNACISLPSCSDGVQNEYEGGIDCGGVCLNECDYELTVLMIPVNWQGSYNQFKGTALLASNFFLDRIPLKDCPNKYKLLIPDQKDYDGNRVLWDGWKCNIQEYGEPGCFSDGEFPLKVIEGCAKRYEKATGRKYDFVVGITDLEQIGMDYYIDFFGNLKCEHWAAGWTSWDSNAVIATTSDIKVVSHELGHQFGFSDQYCDCTNMVYKGIDLGKYCGPNAPINPLNKTLGCNYEGDCCWTTIAEWYPGCHKRCMGNFDRAGEDTNYDTILDSGNRTIMSALVPRNHYDTTEYQFLEKIFQCPVEVSVLSASSQAIANVSFTNKSILELSLSISIEDNVTLNYINVTYGHPQIIPTIPGDYSIKILDENGIALYESNFSLNFFLFSNQSYFTNHTSLYRKMMYNTSMREVQLYHSNTLIFQKEISFCNFDNRCEADENYYSCPNDCESWSDDGICNNEYDGVCDPNCLLKYDLDCKESINISLIKGWNLISIPLETENNSISYIFNDSNIYSYKNNSWFMSTEINNKLGYWLKVNESKNITLIGTEVEDKTISLDEGWNLVGYPYLTEIGINNSSLNNYTIFTYINNSWLSYNPNRINPLNTLKELIPGYGYWTKAK